MRVPILLRAAEVAARAHAGQRRKGGEVPYVVHPLEVARLVAEDGRDEASVLAALLHDVVEDSDMTLDEISASFGPEVADLVAALTDTPGTAALPRAERKRRQAAHVAAAPEAARAIKLADQTSNLRDMVRLPNAWAPDDARAYLDGTGLVAAACRDAAPGLAAQYDDAAAAVRVLFDHAATAPDAIPARSEEETRP